ncbi:MAG: glycoside hydrolase family 36 protein [Acidimicrobiales bacterium]
MKLVAFAVDLEVDGSHRQRQALGSGRLQFGPMEVTIAGIAGLAGLADPDPDHAGVAGWAIANRGEVPAKIRSVAIVYKIEGATMPLRMLRHGYQSWSPSDVATLGVDVDPSRTPGSLDLVRGAAHADQRPAREGELRSEWVTVIQGAGIQGAGIQGAGEDGGRDGVLVGFDGGDTHDGTLRLLQAAGDAPELSCEAFLGGARLDPGAERALHGLVILTGDSPSSLLTNWAGLVGARGRARVDRPYQVGWCSWYHYFHGVTERDLFSNLAEADRAGWPFDVFQLDDGYQRSIGDWLETNEKFPTPLSGLAARIAASGRSPGIWIAPFLAAPDSRVATDHPQWLARLPGGDPLPGIVNPPWGGGRGGLMWTLDTTHPEVQEHLEAVARALTAMGFSYLKLDFTYAASFDGLWHDDTLTPAQRVRAGYDAVRRGAGPEAFILGCGVPLSNVVGVVDGSRIGTDVAPSWDTERDDAIMAGYSGMLPATSHAAASTFTRSFMHRTLWLNDPDCLMLRGVATQMSAGQVETWARSVAQSGGMAIVSDDLSLLDGASRRLFEDVVATGRRSDAEAAHGNPARCEDLMEAVRQPSVLAAAGQRLVVDPVSGESRLDPA